MYCGGELDQKQDQNTQKVKNKKITLFILIRQYKTCIYFQWRKKKNQAANRHNSLTKNDMGDI